ncbi:MAG: NAD(P)H-dependent oxidoreductase [Pseudomonadota bacterium]
MPIKILALCGSSQANSLNGKLLATAMNWLKARELVVTQLDLAALNLPIYHAELDAAGDPPEGVMTLQLALREHHAILLASPEYNGFFTPLLKNAVDWASRTRAGQSNPFAGKIAALLAASPGVLGGIRGLPMTRLLLANLGAVVIAQQMSLPRAHEAFAAQGELLDARQQQMLEGVLGELLEMSRRQSASI